MLPLALGLCILTAIMWWLLLIPITIYNGYKYYKLRDHIILQKRYSSITIYEVIIMIIKLIWGVFLFFMVGYFGEGSIWSALFEIPYQFLSFMLLYCWVWRFWLIHYDTNFTLSTVKQDWAIIINRRFKDLKTNWYINNKSKYGNYHWFKKHIIIPAILIQSFLIILPIIYFAFIHQRNVNDSVWHELQLLSSANLCIPFILLLLIYLRTPSFNDNLLISLELKWIFIILLIKNILNFSIFLYQIIEDPPVEIDIICFFFFLNISNCGQWFAILIATYYVNKQVTPIIAKQQYKIMDYHTISQRRNSASIPYLKITCNPKIKTSTIGSDDDFDNGGSPQSAHSNKSHNINYDDIKLLHIIQNIEGFEAFVVHLSYEFCTETLLSFTEIIQYQQYISLFMKQKSINIDHEISIKSNESTIGPINTNQSSDYNKSLFERIKLPKQLPKSSIVYDGMDEHYTQNIHENEFINMMKIKAYKLYKKYVAVGIQYQVNISYSTRKGIEKYVKNYDSFLLNDQISLNQLLFLFEKVSEEIYNLMTDSFNRFSQTNEFQKLAQMITSKKTF